MESFFTGCVNAGPEGCPFWAPTAANICQNLTSLYDSLRSWPRPMKTDTGYGLLDYSMLRGFVFLSLYSPYRFFLPLAHSLAEPAFGNGTTLFQLASQYSPTPFQCSYDPTERMFDVVDDALSAIACNDGDDVPADLVSSQGVLQYFDEDIIVG